MSNAVLVSVQVRGIVRPEDDVFIAGFPRLEIYSEGDTPEEAKEHAEDALRLWVESCIDRGTMHEALRELGWHRSPKDAPETPEPGAHIHVLHLEDTLGEPWEGKITIPAYQAAELLAANG